MKNMITFIYSLNNSLNPFEEINRHHGRGNLLQKSSEIKITDWMTAIGTLIGATGAVAALFTLLFQIRENKKAKLRPPRGLLDNLLLMNSTLLDIMNGGKESVYFLDSERKKIEAILGALEKQIADPELLGFVIEVLEGYNKCFALSPGSGMLNEPENAARVQKQIDTASTAQTICTAATYRIGEITRGEI